MNSLREVTKTLAASPKALLKVVTVVGAMTLAVALIVRSETVVDDVLLYTLLLWMAKIIYLQPDYFLKLVEPCGSEVVFRIPTQGHVAALTIDDVPLLNSPTHFEEILDVLKKHGVQATFFIMSGFVYPPEEGGMQAEERERCLALLRRAVSEGHELGNHLQFDKPAVVMSPEDFDNAFMHCDRLISELHGHEQWAARPKHWFRPASALWNGHILATAAAKGYTTVLANCFPHDVAAVTRCLNAPYLCHRARPGAVIAVHDRWHTPATLDKALPKIRQQGLQLGTLSALQVAAESEQEQERGGRPARQPQFANAAMSPLRDESMDESMDIELTAPVSFWKE